jgi:hypothetical protein
LTVDELTRRRKVLRRVTTAPQLQLLIAIAVETTTGAALTAAVAAIITAALSAVLTAVPVATAEA